MSRRTRDLLTLVLLALAALVLALDLALGPSPRRAWVPLLAATDPPGALQAEGADRRALAATAAAVGEVVTIEDLVRLVVALEEGTDPDLPPLDEETRAELRPLLERARAHRDELLALEGELGAAEADLQAAASELAAALSPEQREWIVGHRDEISVLDVEDAYWRRAGEALR